MTFKRYLSDDEIAKIIEDMGPTLIGSRIETSATTLYDLAVEVRDRRLLAGAIGKPSDIEVIAERLAKVEDRLAGPQLVELSQLNRFAKEIHSRLDAFGKELHGVNIGESEHYAKLGERIDKVVEIIGERVSGLVDRMTAIENGDAQDYAYALKGLDEVRLRAGLGTMQAEHPRGGPAFPTGARTAEAAAEAVLPVPQRGDRVRLEGAFGTMSGKRIKDGWYDVIGADSSEFQIKVPFDEHGSATPSWVPWLPVRSSFLKEVKANGTPR